MLDADVMAVLTGAAGNVVAYLLNGRADAAKKWLARVLRAATSEERTSTMQALDRDTAAVKSGQAVEAELQAKWLATLAMFLAQHPEARSEVEALAAATSDATGAQTIGSQINLGSGTIVGRDNFGDINPPNVR